MSSPKVETENNTKMSVERNLYNVRQFRADFEDRERSEGSQQKRVHVGYSIMGDAIEDVSNDSMVSLCTACLVLR